MALPTFSMRMIHLSQRFASFEFLIYLLRSMSLGLGLFNYGLVFLFLGMFAIGSIPTGVIAMKIHDRSTGSDI